MGMPCLSQPSSAESRARFCRPILLCTRVVLGSTSPSLALAQVLCCSAISNNRSSGERANSSASRAALEELEEEPPPEDAARAARAASAAFLFSSFSSFSSLAFAFSSAVFSCSRSRFLTAVCQSVSSF